MKTSKIYRWATVAVLLGASFPGAHLYAAPLTDEDAQALIKRVDELEQEVKSLKGELQGTHPAYQTTSGPVTSIVSTNAANVTLGANGLKISSTDSNFVMIAHGYVQADDRTYLGQKTTPDTMLLRRVRPIIEGTVWNKFNYRLMLDLASGSVTGSSAANVGILDDAYVNARLLDQLQIQAGKYKSPVGLERLQSTADLFFVETGFATELTPNYDLGLEVHNDYFNTPIGYSLGIFDGSADNASGDSDADEGKDVVARLFFQPFLNKDIAPLKRLGFGAAGTVGTHGGETPTAYKTAGQQTFFTYSPNLTSSGNQYRYDPQAYYYWGPFGLQGEYVMSSQKFASKVGPPLQRYNNTAWQVEGSYFLTGEQNSFKSSSLQHVVPLHPLFNGGWGAFEVVARLQQLSLDNNVFRSGTSFASATSAQQATGWSAGVNWYLNSNIKLNLDYESAVLSGGNASKSATALKDEHAILSQVQFQF
jgi:phosphate-selective porin OprO/OprP